MYLVDALHQNGIGVILDWVPSHFPNDEHGLYRFDGTHLYEHADPRQGYHPDWNSAIFNYGRNEVRAFLISSALFWLEHYHIDGLRVDAVASMLYLDYGRRAGEWIPNRYGGRENLDAIHFLRTLNEAVYRDHPDVQMIAEESTAWPMVSRPIYLGGLGFGLKWNMGWMHDTLRYMHRGSHPSQIPSRHAHVLAHLRVPRELRAAALARRSGARQRLAHRQDAGRHLAAVRQPEALYGYMWAHPGKKLLFMGGEFGQRREWQHEESLEWWVLAVSGARRAHAMGRRSQPRLRLRARAARSRFRSAGFRVDRLLRFRREHVVLHPQIAQRREHRPRRMQLHAGAARELPARRAASGLLAGSC